MPLVLNGHGGNVVGSLGSGSLIQDMPSAYSFGTYDLDYAGSFIDCGDRTEFEFADSIGFILAGWVKLAKFSDHQFIAGKSNWAGTSHSEYFIGMNNDGRFHWVCNNGTNGGTCQSNDVYNNEVEKEEWTHIMGVRDTSNNLTLYINGIAQTDTETCTGSIGVSSQDLGIGTRNSGGTPDLSGDYFRGNIRDVRLYSGSATAPELQDIFTDTNCGGVTLAGGSIKGWWKLGGDLLDSSGNDFTGVLTTGADSTDYWDKSIYKLNQIGSGSASGSATISGGTWNLRDSTTFTNLNGTSAYYDLGDSSNLIDSTTVTYSIWFNCTDGDTSSAYMIANQKGDGSTNMSLTINRDDTGSGDAGQLSGFLWNGATHVFAAYDAAINDGEWHNAVYTTSGSVQGLYLDGVQVAAGSGTFVNAATTDDMTIGAFEDGASEFFDGDISTTIIDDKAWTAEQVALYYEGQWVGSPAHMFKFNEGAGNASDSGRGTVTAQQQVATWVKSDYDMLDEGGTAGALVAISGAKLSAPQAELQLGQNENHSIEVDTYIHNSGTLLIDANTGAGVNGHFYDEGNNYYNVIKTGSGYSNSWHSSTNGDTIVENTFDLKQSSMRFFRKLNMGTTGSRGTIICTADSSSLTGYSDFHLAGVSEIYPAFVTSSAGGGVSFQSTTYLSDVEWDFNQATRGGGYIHTLSGNCKFNGDLTITAGDRWDVNGEYCEIDGSFTFGAGSTLYNTLGAAANIGYLVLGDEITGGSTNNAGYLNIIQDGNYFNPETATYNHVFFRGGLHTIGGARNFGTTPITIGAATNFNANSDWGNIAIASAGVMDGNNDIITCKGDFNMAGGFIGKGALDFSNGPSSGADSADEYLLGASGQTFTEAGITMEAWFRGTNTDAIQYIFDGYFTGGYKYNYIAISAAGKLQAVAAGMGTTETLYSTTTITDGAWHHLAYTYYDTGGGGNDNISRLYIDGKMEAESYLSETGGSPYTLNTFAIGAANDNAGGYSYGLSGALARVSVWKTALTESNIRSMMFQDWSTMAAADVIDDSLCFTWYEFSDSVGATSVSDMSGSGNTGTLSTTDAWAGPGTFTYDESTLLFGGADGETQYIKGNGTLDFYNVTTSGANVIVDNKNYTTLNINNTLTLGSGTLYGDTTSGSTYTNIRFRNTGTSDDYAVCLVDGIHRGDGPDANVPDGMVNIWGGGVTWYGNYMQVPAGTYAGMNTYGSVKQVGDIISWRAKSGGTYENDNIGALSYYGRWDTNGYDILSCEGLKSNETGSQWTFSPGTSVFFRQYGTDATWGFNTAQGATGQYNMNGEAAAMFTDGSDIMYIGAGVSGTYNALGDHTFSCWVKLNPPSTIAGLITKGWTGELSYYIQATDGTNKIKWVTFHGEARGQNNLDSATAVADDTWHHLGFTYNSADGYKKIYIDGVISASSNTAGASDLSSADELFGLGSWFSGPTTNSSQNYGIGMVRSSLADVRVWDGTVLTDANMVTLAAINPATNVSGAVYAENPSDPSSWWKFGNTGSGIPAIDLNDYGTNGYDAVMTGSSASPAGMKSGFVTFQKADPTDVDNYPFEHDANYDTSAAAGTVTLTNTYVSGSQDIILADGNVLHTKGTVVME